MSMMCCSLMSLEWSEDGCLRQVNDAMHIGAPSVVALVTCEPCALSGQVGADDSASLAVDKLKHGACLTSPDSSVHRAAPLPWMGYGRWSIRAGSRRVARHRGARCRQRAHAGQQRGRFAP